MNRPYHCIGCGVRRKAKRRAHVCSVCSCVIERLTEYVQDMHWAPYGEGARYCLPCAERIEAEWEAWRTAPSPMEGRGA